MQPQPNVKNRRIREALWWPPYVILLTCVVLSTPALYLLTARDQRINPPTCFGIGWGCTPDPASMVALYLMFIALPAFVVASLLMAALGLAGRRSRWLRLGLSAAIAVLLLVWIAFIV